MDSSRVNVRTSDIDTVFFVRQAARSDSGEYELNVQIENMKDTATIRIRVVGAWPGRGRGRPTRWPAGSRGGRGGEDGPAAGSGETDTGDGARRKGTKGRGRGKWGEAEDMSEARRGGKVGGM